MIFSSRTASNTLTLEKLYESYWESDIDTVSNAFKINQNTFNLESSDDLIKAYTSKESAYNFFDYPAELLLHFYDDSLKLIGCRIYFENDQELYTFMCNRIEEYDQQYEIVDTGTSSLLRTRSSIESFQKTLEEYLKSDGIFVDSLTWNYNSPTLLKMSVIKVSQNENAAMTIYIFDDSLTRDFLGL